MIIQQYTIIYNKPYVKVAFLSVKLFFDIKIYPKRLPGAKLKTAARDGRLELRRAHCLPDASFIIFFSRWFTPDLVRGGLSRFPSSLKLRSLY